MKQYYVSEADRFLAKFNETHEPTDSVKAEIERSVKIARKRDGIDIEDNDSNL